MENTFNWALFQVIIDCLLIALVLFLLYVLFREYKQRLLLKKWILRQLRLHGVPVQDTGQTVGERHPPSAEEAIDRLQREIDLARQVLHALEIKVRVPKRDPAPPESEEPGPEVETVSSPAAAPTQPATERPDAVQEAIRYLIKKGMRPLEISKQLHIPIEDVERAYEPELGADR